MLNHLDFSTNQTHNKTCSFIQNDTCFFLSETNPFAYNFPNPNPNPNPNPSETHQTLNPKPKTKAKTKMSKRDRHSKIVTSSRPRHRRMRLSIDVARQFFDLQERLGFDRASKTVEWLLVHSRSHINKLNNNNNNTNSDSECQQISGLDQVEQQQQVSDNMNQKAKRKYNRRSAVKPARRSAFDAAAREARDIARKRARKRTIEKKNKTHHNQNDKGLVASSNENLITNCDDLMTMETVIPLLFADNQEININNNNKDEYLTVMSDDYYCNNSFIYNGNINNALFEQRQLDQYEYLSKAWNQVSTMTSTNHNNMW